MALNQKHIVDVAEKSGQLVRASRRHARTRRMLAVLGCIAILATALSLMLPALSMTRGQLVCDLEEHAHSASCYEKVLVCGQEEGEGADSETGEGGHKHTDKCYEKQLVCETPEHKHSDACYEKVEPEAADGQGEGSAGDSDGADHDAGVADDGAVADGSGGSDALAGDGSDSDTSSDAADASGNSADAESAGSASAVEANSAEDMPAQSFKADLKDKDGKVTLTVEVEAPEGAFPAATFMKIDGVPAKDVADAVQDVVRKSEGVGVRVKSMTAVDIVFREGGPDGKQIEPAKKVKVKITSPDVRDFDDPMLVHVVDKSRESAKGKTDDAEVVEKVKIVNQNEDDKTTGAEDTMQFKASEFSPYVIVELEELTTQVIAASGETYDVKVTYGPDSGIPQGAQLQVEEIVEGEAGYEEYLSQVNHELGGRASFARFFDITIVAEGVKVQPSTAVRVQIALSNAADLTDDVKAVHFSSADQLEILDTKLKDGAVSFDAGSFSIYAVVDDEVGGENARIGYRFWYNDGSQNVLLSTQYFRYKDVHPSGDATALTINEPSIPGIESATWNRIFRGWSKTSVNDSDENLTTVELLNQELSSFTEGAYVEGTYIDLYANLKNVYYVTYVDVNPNNVLATEIVPKEESDDTTFTVKPESELRPTIDSDTVLQGWYDIERPNTVYLPGQENVVLTSSLTLYPKIEGGSWLVFNDNDPVWDPDKQEYVSGGASFTPPAFYLEEVTQRPPDPTWTGYEFGGWYTDKECTNEFQFGTAISHDTTVYAKWIPSASSYRVIIWKQRASDANAYDYVTSYLVDTNVVTGQTVALDSSYTNIYGNNGTSTDTDKGFFTYNAGKTDQSVVVKADGSSVLNVYYDRKPVTLGFYVWDYVYTVSTNDNDNNPEKYGDVSGQKTRVYWRNGAFRVSNNNNAAVYTGVVYTRSYNRSWQVYKAFTGLYGSTLEENGYTWPNENNWFSNGHGTGGNASTGWVGWNYYYDGDTSGTRTTFMSAFLPTEVDTSGDTITVNFYGSNSTGSSYIHFLTQNLDGTYTEKNTVQAGSGNFYISDKYTGYHAAQYSTNGTSWTSVGNKTSNGYYNNGQPVSYNNNLYIRFDLNNYNLTFYTNNSSNQLIDYTVPYSKSLSGYADQNPGQRRGYYFLGWYADPSCTEEFDFAQTMPDTNVAVYGKWKKRRVRVVLEPGANNVYMGSQAQRFRVDFDECIDGGLMESAQRAGYILDGWYTDPDFTNRLLFSSPVNDDTTDVDWTYQTSASWASARAAYGDDSEEYENVRGILHLYAKWIPDTNSTGINVVYDPGDAAIYDSLGALLTTVPIDTHMYTFDGTTTVREAPLNYNELYTFKYWEATTEDGVTVHWYPGDPASLAELAFADPVYDENGDLLRKTVTLRAVYDLTGDPSRVTTITFDGDTFTDTLYNGTSAQMQGKTNDGTQRLAITLDKEVNQTVELPTADDFYLDGWELVGWSFTEGTYAEQVAAATSDAPNFEPGQKVAADNLTISNLNGTANTLYAMWKPKHYTVTVKQVIEAGVPASSFSYPYKAGVESGIATATEIVQSLANNSSFTVDTLTSSTDALEYYNRVGHVMRITTPTIDPGASYSVRVNAVVTKDDGTTEVLNPTAAGDYQILGDVTITYTYSPKVLVKLQKRDATNHGTALRNAVFAVTPVEFNTATNQWENAGSGQTLTVNADTFEQYLQEGTYRITETNAPVNYASIGIDLFLRVNSTGAFDLFTESGASVDSSVAELGGTGSDLNRVLVVYDNPIRTVTLSKQVEDEQGSFSFTVTVFNSDDSRLRNYTIGQQGGTALTTNSIGQVTLSLGHGESVDLDIPHGCKLLVSEAHNPRYVASYKWNNNDSVTSNTFEETPGETLEDAPKETPVSITENGTLAFTNTLASVPITLKKVSVNNTDETPIEVPIGGATFTVYTTADGPTVAKDASGASLSGLTASSEEESLGVFFGGSLKVGTYYLEETSVPAGHNAPMGRFELVVPAPGAKPTIKGTWISGNPTGSEGTVTGNAIEGYVVTVRNTAGIALPSTGGMGTGPLMLLGVVLVAGAAAFLVARRRPLVAISREWAYIKARDTMGRRAHERKGFTRIVVSRKKRR